MILEQANSGVAPWRIHVGYESLHPLATERALWPGDLGVADDPGEWWYEALNCSSCTGSTIRRWSMRDEPADFLGRAYAARALGKEPIHDGRRRAEETRWISIPSSTATCGRCSLR